MVELYRTDRRFDPRRVYEIWLEIVQNESLYDSMMRGEHTIAITLGYTAEDLAILDDFAIQPGTRWHVENLRYRATMMVSRIVDWHLPATMRLLTGAVADWQRDLVFEYLALHRWIEFGHHRRFAECRRFVEFVQSRVLKRRRPPEHINDVLALEVGALEVLSRASRIEHAGWLARSQGELVVRGPAQAIVEVNADVVDWVRAPRGPVHVGTHGHHPVLLYVASPASDAAMEPLEDRSRRVLEAIATPTSFAELVARESALGPTLARWRELEILVSA